MPDAGENTEDRSTATYPSRHVRVFLAARFAVATAWQMQGVALGWYVYALTDSALALGLIGLVQFTPMIGLALPAGHIVDRHARRAVALTAYAIEGSCSLALALMAYAGTGGAVAVFAVIAGYGVGRALEQPAI